MTCSLLAHIQQIFRIQLSSDRVVHLYTFYRVSWQELLMFIASKYPCIVMSDLVRPMSNLSAIWSQFNRDKWHGLNSHHSPGSATRTPIKHAVISLPNKSGPTCHHLEIDDWDYRMCVCVFLYKCEVIFSLCASSPVISVSFLHIPLTPLTSTARFEYCGGFVVIVMHIIYVSCFCTGCVRIVTDQLLFP